MPINHYKKGARLERELVQMFNKNGFCVVRAAGSGTNALSPDLIALKGPLQYGLEVKGVQSPYLYLSSHQYTLLTHWNKITQIATYVAWRRKNEQWLFIPLFLFSKTKGGRYVALWDDILPKAHRFEDLL